MTEVHPPGVVMYRTHSCPFCIAAAQLLADLSIACTEVFLDDHKDRRAFTEQILPGHRTVPLVVIDGEPIGGFRELQELHGRGGLDTLRGTG